MTPLKITFEVCDGYTFAHIWSTDGVFGHAQEVKDRIPAGTIVTMPSRLYQLTPWLIEKCDFVKKAVVIQDGNVVEILVKE